MELKPGSRWKSAVCSAEMVVVRPPSSAGTLECGGSAVLPHGVEATGGEPAAAFSEGVLIGKRYMDEESGLEVLGAKPGKGSLSFNGRAMTLKDAKPLPASD